MAPDHQRLTWTQRSWLLTCLEAIDEGYSFVSRCSGCDCYIANCPLNAIAMKKERAQLSWYWQCTSVHNFGDLASLASSRTPYRPVKQSKYNCASMSCTFAASSVKRARLFSPTIAYTIWKYRNCCNKYDAFTIRTCSRLTSTRWMKQSYGRVQPEVKFSESCPGL